jgi:hypothetical protein
MDGERPDTSAESRLEQTTEELDGRLQQLEDHLDDAQAKAAQRRREATGEDVAGDWDDTKPTPAGGDDPKGALS